MAGVALLRRRALVLPDGAARLALVRRWGVSVASLLSGLLALFVFRRGVPHVGWIAGYAVVLWGLAAGLRQARDRLLARGRAGVVRAGDYAVQTLCHGLLLFVLPGYVAATTLDGPTAPFLVLLAGAALLTTVDPWYRIVVAPRPWAGRAVFGLSLFAGGQVALVLVGLPPGAAVPLSAALAVVALVLVEAGLAARWGRLAALGVGGSLLAATLAWLATPWIPPVPLSLVRPTMARDVVGLEPVGALVRVSAAELAAGGGLVAFTPVAAPARLRQPVLHRWRHEGREVGRVLLTTPVQGGRRAGFRTYSRKRDFPADPTGRWTVDVLTAEGQLVGRVRFRVDP